MVTVLPSRWNLKYMAQPARAATAPPSVLLRETVGGIAVLTLNRPAARNSLSEGLIGELHAALDAIAGDSDRARRGDRRQRHRCSRPAMT